MWETIIIAIPIGLFFGFVALPKKYKATKSKELPNLKPKLQFYPTYTARFMNLAALEEKLNELGYASISQNNYERGFSFGDFSAKIAKTRVEINPGKNTFKITYGGAGVFFDTGDLWKIAASLNKC